MADDVDDPITPSPETIASSRAFDERFSRAHEAGWQSGFLDGAGFVLERVLELGIDAVLSPRIVGDMVRRFGAEDVIRECRRRRLQTIVAWIEEQRAEAASATTAKVLPASLVDEEPADNGPTAVGGYQEASGWKLAQPVPKGPRSSR